MADALSRPSEMEITAGRVVAVHAATHQCQPSPAHVRTVGVPPAASAQQPQVLVPSPVDVARAQLQNKEEMEHYFRDSSLDLKLLPSSTEPGALPLLCDMSQGMDRHRLVVPRCLVPQVLQFFHGISHGGGKATLRLVRARFIWSRMSDDCLSFVRSCSSCQASKIVRHVHSPSA